MKVCSKCKVEKEFGDFHKNKITKNSGLQSSCKQCRKSFALNNAESIKKNRDLYRLNFKDKIKQQRECFNKNNPNKRNDGVRFYRANNPEKVKVSNKRLQEKLSDATIIGMMKKQNYSDELINNPEIIEIKRLIIKTKRLCRK